MIIYQILNKINNKSYIGQTRNHLSARWSRHLQQLKKDDYPLYRAIRKYGLENFEIKIICECSSLKELNEKETYYINTLNTLVPNGYNCTTGGEQPIYSEESRRKNSLARKENIPWNKGIKTGPLTKEHNLNKAKAHQKQVKRISLNGEIYIYKSIKETELDGFNPSQVTLCCKYPLSHKTHYGYKWEYIDKKHIKELNKTFKHNSGRFVKGQRPHNSYKVRTLNILTNEELIFNSTSDAALHFNYKNYNTVSAYCKQNKIVNNIQFSFLQ